MQTSEEYSALSLCTYAMARQNLDRALEDSTWTALPSQVPSNSEQASTLGKLPPAIIVDIDETILSTLPYQAWLMENNRTFSSESWNAWVSDASAAAIPGALEFVQYAMRQGVAVFYISNRHARGPLDRNLNGHLGPGEMQVNLTPFTVANLVRLGFLPQHSISNDDALLLRGETGEDGRIKKGWGSSDKTARRESLSSDNRILLIIGDDRNDFSPYSDHGNDKVRVVDNQRKPSLHESLHGPDGYRSRWGHSWFLLPNPVYGSWERRLYEARRSFPEEEKTNIMIDRLETWR